MIELIKKKVSLGMIIFCGISYQNQSSASSVNEGVGNDSDKEELVYTPACKKASEKHDLNNNQIMIRKDKYKFFTQDKSLERDEALPGKKLDYSFVQENITKNDMGTNNIVSSLEERITDSNFDFTQKCSNESKKNQIEEERLLYSSYIRAHSISSVVKHVSLLYKSWEDANIFDTTILVNKREGSMPSKMVEDRIYKGNDRDYDILSKQERFYQKYNSKKKNDDHHIKSSLFCNKKDDDKEFFSEQKNDDHHIKSSLFCNKKDDDKEFFSEQKKNALAHCNISPLTQDERYLDVNKQFLSKKNLKNLFDKVRDTTDQPMKQQAHVKKTNR